VTSSKALRSFHRPVQDWFTASFEAPTKAQERGWPKIAGGQSTLLLAPTGSGKTLAAFLAALDRIMFSPEPEKEQRLRVLYVSPLKALGVDIEKNLRAPIAGIAAVAARAGHEVRVPTVSIRSGDTPQRERAQFARRPPDILITTPESLYLLLTSEARKRLTHVDTLIIDEIHAVAATKRGAHLMTSIERLETLRAVDADGAARPPLQRIGLSATQRPLEEIARFLGGLESAGRPRPVEIVDAGSKRSLEIVVEVPVEDMARLKESQPDVEKAERGSIWPSIHPRLVELVRAHRSTMIFTNSRRLAERLASALNEVAEEEIALAHHGSIAKDTRRHIEDRLKAGTLPAIVATSSLELGIDMGAVDLVIQIEAPPSVASGMQRIGRSGHVVGAVSKGIVFPKYRGDLLACAAAVAQMRRALVEETIYLRNPLDVLAQQIVATVATGPVTVDALYDQMRRAAPFEELPRSSFEGVLDMLSGRYPSDEFAELRARITWDRVAGMLTARRGAQRIAVINAGTIPDRGLYGVFLESGDEKKSMRVGELDEEMVFESRPGEVFLLGASSWRIQEITHDRVTVTPAPGEPGKMPFWHGDRPGRPASFGREVGALARELAKSKRDDAHGKLVREHGLDELAANNLLLFIQDQLDATGEVPSDRTIVVERFLDEVGDHRVCILSPYGARVHAPWAMAATAMVRDQTGAEVDAVWSDDGIVFRLPEAEHPPEASLFLPLAEDVERLLTQNLGTTALFAARFRENAARALLLPRRQPGRRSPLWAQRRRSADLLSVASRYGSFPILLETYRECLRDVFDLPALVDTLRRIASRKIRLVTVDSRTPSPFAKQLLFSFVANFIYDGDAPLAEKRAQALSIDQAQLKELLGEAELRELLDPDAMDELGRALQRLDGRKVRHVDGLHDLLLHLGDLSRDEIRERSEVEAPVDDWLQELLTARRVIEVVVGGTSRIAAAEDAGRLRDGLGIVPPMGLPYAFTEPVADPLGDLCSRYARTHTPFAADDVAARFGVGVAPIRQALEALSARDRLLCGGFRPGGRGTEWCDPGVLRSLKRRSLAKLRKEVEPVEQASLARFLGHWHDVRRADAAGRGGLDALLTVLEQLQGAPIPASALLGEVLPARIRDFAPTQLDELCAAGEILWRGIDSIGPNDGRVALYLVDQYALLAPPAGEMPPEPAPTIMALLNERGALFFADLVAATGGFPNDLLQSLWDLVWSGWVTNDTTTPLRAILPKDERAKRRGRDLRRFRSRRAGPPGSEGRWALLPKLGGEFAPTATARATALATVLLERHGVLTREAALAENIPGGFSAVYPVLKAMEEAGRVRRGYFIAGLGATQFARPGADDRLRAFRDRSETPETLVLAATDPANPYGAALPWPASDNRPQRSAGAQVVLHDGQLVAYVGKGERSLLTFLPDQEPARTEAARAIARALAHQVDEGGRRALMVAKIDGEPPRHSALSAHLVEVGFSPSAQGYLKRTSRKALPT